MRDFTVIQRWLHGVKLCAGLGLLAGGFEALAMALNLALPLSLTGFAVTGGSAMLAMAALAMLFAMITGPMHFGLKSMSTYRSMALHMGLVTILIVGFYLWQGSAELVRRQNPIGAAAMALMPIGFGGVAYYNARFWLKKKQIGAKTKLGFLPVATLAGLVLVAAGTGIRHRRDTGGAFALENDPNVVFILVDGLRWDHVGHLGGKTETPRIDKLSRQGVTFANAVTPAPEGGPSLATALTGLHPLRHERITNDHPLHPGARTFAEVVKNEGWATGGFASSSVGSAETGAARGMRSYDDAFGPGPVGLTEVNLLGWLARQFAPRTHRTDAETVDRFQAWYAKHSVVPHFAVIQLSGPDRATDSAETYVAAVRAVDVEVGRIFDLIEDADEDADTLVVFAGLGGVLLGEHESSHPREGLWDELVRVPLVVRNIKLNKEVDRVEAQVRMMDLTPTALAFAKLDQTDETEGIELLGFVAGTRTHTVWCSMVGRDRHGAMLGLRNNGIKYLSRVDGGDERLYEVTTDPTESTDLSTEQPATLEQARRLVSGERSALKRIVAAHRVVAP